MRDLHILCLLLCAVVSAVAGEEGDLQDTVSRLEESVRSLIRQHTLDRLYVDERIRSDGSSGIKSSRLRKYGTKTYHSESHAGLSVASIHNHPNNKLTIGMGEFVAVLNGVEFRTRHNDYALVKPASTTDYFAVENIELPAVPPEIEGKSVPEQIEIMRAYFKAFADQNSTVYDYTSYFKPVMCYLEGTWTKYVNEVKETFASDRHFLDAKTWYDMEEIIRFQSASGSKDSNENKSYLPTKLVGVVNDTIPQVAQWSYRILCHPLKDDLPLDRLHLVDDLLVRMRHKVSLADLAKTRAARFQLAQSRKGKFRDVALMPDLLDELMYEIPGLNNYGSILRDDSFGSKKNDFTKRSELNSARYHRMFFMKEADAMGSQMNTRGFNDQYFFGAMNTQENVVPTSMNDCKRETKYEECVSYSQKWSYAIPLEIIYTTPLTKWNPYNLQYFDRQSDATSGGRTGKNADKALHGISRRLFHQTPAEFFTGTDPEADTADTSSDAIYVTDDEGQPQAVRASGHYIFLPEISGVGTIRQRWPVMPIHGEGSQYQKEVDALKEIVLRPVTNAYMFYEDIGGSGVGGGGGGGPAKPSNTNYLYETPASNVERFSHKHLVTITQKQIDQLMKGGRVNVVTEVADGHTHTLRLTAAGDSNGATHIFILKCGKTGNVCWDGHTGELTRV